ncbi:MAG: GNAT family N-acetyltransferase [Thermoleophilaceae bacterium]|nr:GNAT family N-acetyltransferase [Thermoleophilaceae bacterium]
MSRERIVSYLRRTEEAVVDEVRPLGHATALLTPSLPLVWQLNAVRVEDSGAGARELVATTEHALEHASHRKLVVHDEELGERLAPALSRDGWNVYRLLVMVRDRTPARMAPHGAGSEVDRATGAGALAAFRREQPFGWQEEAVQQLTAMDERYGRATRARDFAAPPSEPAAACRLYTADGLAQVDEVGTLERRRGRGHASAAVLAAAATAASEGCDPIFLLTDAADWPQHLYERLGFSPIGKLYEFLKLPLGTTRP